MNDNDYIKAGVELAYGWIWLEGNIIQTPSDVQGTVHSVILRDALAAQLVRQVDASTCGFASLSEGHAAVYLDTWGNEIVTAQGSDRTMNAIRAIVDSKVLEPGDE